MAELVQSIEKTKSGTAPGDSGIPAEGWKLLEGKNLTGILTLFNEIFEEETIPAVERLAKFMYENDIIIPLQAGGQKNRSTMELLTKKIIKIIRDLYKDNTGVIRTPFGDTDSFPITRGVRQGDTLSPLLFIIALNPIRY